MIIEVDDMILKDFLAEVVAVGIRRHEESLRPNGKTINQSQAKEYLKRLGFKASTLAKMVEQRVITPIKPGESRNSSVLYSTQQFYAAVDNMRINRKYNKLIIPIQ